MKKYPLFSEMKKGDKVTRPVFISDIKEQIARTGTPFVKITMKDEQDFRTANLFDTTVKKLKDEKDITKDVIAVVTLEIGEWNNAPSYNIRDIKLNTDNSVKREDFITMPPVDCDQMFHTIITLLEDSAAPDDEYVPISTLAIDLLNKYQSEYMKSSAAVSVHHNIRGGLLYHSYRMVLSADALSKVYTFLDRELLISGAALHDIGKIFEYDTNEMGEASVTKNGIMFGHLFIGARMVLEQKNEKKYNKEKVGLLAHMILSHHNKPEWGAVKSPATAEAMALYFIDDLDAKMYSCEKCFNELEPGCMTEKRVFGLDNNIYRPKYTAVDKKEGSEEE